MMNNVLLTLVIVIGVYLLVFGPNLPPPSFGF